MRKDRTNSSILFQFILIYEMKEYYQKMPIQNEPAYLEKILVDLFGRGLSGSIISRPEYQAVYEDSFKKYAINQPKMFRYARRRGIETKIVAFIQDKTNIKLENTK